MFFELTENTDVCIEKKDRCILFEVGCRVERFSFLFSPSLRSSLDFSFCRYVFLVFPVYLLYVDLRKQKGDVTSWTRVCVCINTCVCLSVSECA